MHETLPAGTLTAARAGDVAATSAILARYGPMVWGLCRALDPQPEDAYQDVWEQVLRGLSRFDPDGPAAFSTWLYSVAHHRLVDRERRRKVRARIEPLKGEVADPGDLHGHLEDAERAPPASAAATDGAAAAAPVSFPGREGGGARRRGGAPTERRRQAGVAENGVGGRLLLPQGSAW